MGGGGGGGESENKIVFNKAGSGKKVKQLWVKFVIC